MIELWLYSTELTLEGAVPKTLDTGEKLRLSLWDIQNPEHYSNIALKAPEWDDFSTRPEPFPERWLPRSGGASFSPVSLVFGTGANSAD